MKKTIVALSALAVVGVIGSTLAADNSKVVINGKLLDCNVILQDDRVYVPLRAVSEEMGADVSWDSKTRTASVDYDRSTSDMSQMIADVSSSVVAIVGNYIYESSGSTAQSTAHGSGVVIKSGGEILTNAHVVKDLEQIIVVMNNGEGYEAKLKYIDDDLDLAVIKINKIGLNPIRFASPTSITVGKPVVAIGTPISFSLRNSASAGIISGVNCNISENCRLIQTDAAINPGNSGGPLVNANGELVGINSSKFVSSEIEGMAFAIPVETVQYAINQFELYGKIRKIDPGLSLEESWAATIGLPTDQGLTVTGVETGGAAGDAGILTGDTIIAVGDVQVHSIVDWNEALRRYNIGDGIPVSIERNNTSITCNLIAKEKI